MAAVECMFELRTSFADIVNEYSRDGWRIMILDNKDCVMENLNGRTLRLSLLSGRKIRILSYRSLK